MNISAQQYANLYYFFSEKRSVDFESPLEGNVFELIELSDDVRTDYKGAIYNYLNGNEIIVVHQGTKTLRDFNDNIQMLADLTNPQIKPALLLTQKAINLAGNESNVPVIGHSLGGTLAQVCAFEFGIKAETFNPYGAIDLKYTNLQKENKIISKTKIWILSTMSWLVI
ncbi:hypothetical protein GKC56_02325 [Neisseriaceae bacterium PsAf]|nr:hypothetical protein [Neisseriaceae bacterium PsAf]